MPLGIVRKEDFEAELEKFNQPPPITRGEIIQMPSRGRKEGDNNVPDELRRVIADTAISDGPAEAVDLASQFGISKSSASAYAHGATSTSSYHRPTPALNQTITDATSRIVTKARHKINRAIQHITDEKLKEAKPVDLSTIARNLGAVVKNLEPEKPINPNGPQGPVFVFYTPPQRKEDSYDVIVLKE